MSKKLRKIVIFGGGTAGWMTALYLSKCLNINNNPNIDLTLIESPEIPPIGVGEATVVHIHTFLDTLNIPEDVWLNAIKGSIKLGIKFVGWSGRVEDDVWNHPFDSKVPTMNGFNLLDWWNKQRVEKENPLYSSDCVLNDYLMQNKKAPRMLDEARSFRGHTTYAYHFDASLHARFCKKIALSNGLGYTEDRVIGVNLNAKGEISHLQTQKSGDIHGDLFIDCSGFRGELISKTLKEPFVSYSDSLLCDKAIVMHLPHDSDNLNPYTTATALSSGWVWNIPLQDRTSYGYVYSSAFLNQEEAEKEFREFLGNRSDPIEARHITMRVGRSRNFWVKNCIAVGLSGGFLEPLESTGLLLTQMGIEDILNYLPTGHSDDFLRKEYNRVMINRYESIRNFIILHYCTTGREDTPFWKANKHSLHLPDTVKRRLDRWNNGVLITRIDQLLGDDEVDTTFGLYAHRRLFTGMHYLPELPPCCTTHFPGGNVVEFITQYQAHLSKLSRNYPDHRAFLNAQKK